TLRLPSLCPSRAPKPMPCASAAALQTSPACACCRRRLRRPHPRHLQESHQLGKKAGPRSSCRSVRHLNDKKKPDHWRAGKSEPLNELRLLAFATDSALQRLRLRPRHASLIGGDPRSSSGSLAKFAAIRRTSSLVSEEKTVLTSRSGPSDLLPVLLTGL